MPQGARKTSRTDDTTSTLEAVQKEQHTVTVEKSFTKNLGDYNSAKVTVSITTPVNPTKEELKAVKTTITTLDKVCEEYLEEELKKLDV